MKRLRILHIANWYPNRLDANEGSYVREHIRSLAPHSDNHVIQVRTVKSKEYGLSANFKTERTKISDNESSVLFFVQTTRSFFIELFTFLLLLNQLVIKRKAKGFDVINIHIAYPLGTWLNWIRPFVKQPFVFTEHWSAYHFNFYLDPKTPGLERARRIFRRNIPVITVSEALANDIRNFSGAQIRHEVVPNAVDTTIFRYSGNVPSSPVFLMANSWSPVKQPLLAIEAFEKLLATHPAAQLKIAGYSRGDEWEKMKLYVADKKLDKNITFLGKLTREQIAAELWVCTALLQPTRYETFSVICAEAICCGTPVVASAVGGIPGFINDTNGILVANEATAWQKAMEAMITRNASFNRKAIADDAAKRFSSAGVGQRYFKAIQNLTGLS